MLACRVAPPLVQAARLEQRQRSRRARHVGPEVFPARVQRTASDANKNKSINNIDQEQMSLPRFGGHLKGDTVPEESTDGKTKTACSRSKRGRRSRDAGEKTAAIP